VAVVLRETVAPTRALARSQSFALPCPDSTKPLAGTLVPTGLWLDSRLLTALTKPATTVTSTPHWLVGVTVAGPW
jgi:hypothetical protein